MEKWQNDKGDYRDPRTAEEIAAKIRCRECGEETNRFSIYGEEYTICASCARDLPDPLRDEDMLSGD